MPTIIGYSLRVGFEPTYSPLQVGTFLPIELPEHMVPAAGFDPATYGV